MDIAPRLDKITTFSSAFPPFQYSDSLCEEEAREGWRDQASKAAADEEDGGEPAGDVFLLGDPGETGAELPGDEEPEDGGPEVQTDHAGAGRDAEEDRRAETGCEGHQDHVPRLDEGSDEGGEEAATHEAAVVTRINDDGVPGLEGQGTTDTEGEGHGLVDSLHSAGYEVVEEDDDQEYSPVLDVLLHHLSLVFILPVLGLVKSRHLNSFICCRLKSVS